MPAASPARALPAAIGRIFTPSATASAARPAAAIAAAVCPASTARFCCTAWNFPNGRPNCTRSWAYCVVIAVSRVSAPAICCVRIAAPTAIRSDAVVFVGPAAMATPFNRTRVARLPGDIFTGFDRPRALADQGHTGAGQHHQVIDVPGPGHAGDASRTRASRRPPASGSRVSPSRTGPAVSGPSGMSSPAPASSQLASMVSASGIGAAWAPATVSSDSASATATPKPPAASGTRARCSSASSTADHSAAGHVP